MGQPHMTAHVALTQTKEGEPPRELGRMEVHDVAEFVEDEVEALLVKLTVAIMDVLSQGNPET